MEEVGRSTTHITVMHVKIRDKRQDLMGAGFYLACVGRTFSRGCMERHAEPDLTKRLRTTLEGAEQNTTQTSCLNS